MPIVWDLASGIREPGPLPDGVTGLLPLVVSRVLTDMTPDASALVSSIDGAAGIWQPFGGTGAASLNPEASSIGAGWAPGAPTNISSDGHIVFGRGTCGGVPTYYHLVLPR